MNKLEYCYHTHTYRCGHAEGSDEEYILKAIEMGIKRLGFSDHVILPDYNQPGIRASFDKLEDYLSSINCLKEKYKDQIEIIVGFEAEYYEKYHAYYKELLDSKKIDYLILGQHFYYENGELVRYFYKNPPEENALRYADDLIKGIKSGLFKYVCHPDIFINPYAMWSDKLLDAARRILKACEEYKVPIEVNIGGMRNRYWYSLSNYPSATFFLLSKEYDVDVVIGVDAHAPDNFNHEDINKAIEFVNKHDLRFIDLKI